MSSLSEIFARYKTFSESWNFETESLIVSEHFSVKHVPSDSIKAF